LAEALGVSRLTEEPVLVPVGDGAGRLWVLMVDMAKSWDELVVGHAPDPDVSSRLLENALYRTLTRRFVQSHDYIALDHLVTLADQDRYDLVIVDTPPSGHALDLLDAPGRMIEFFESRLLRWLTVGAGSGVTALAASRSWRLLSACLAATSSPRSPISSPCLPGSAPRLLHGQGRWRPV
jgi:anion-transporting  ArsA/GET3 family ATPase